jgi:zinc-ribbon domain
VATNYCKHCGTPLSSKDNFCSNCGQSLETTPTVTQESYKAPQAPTPPLTPNSRPDAAFWLGLIGGIFGLLIGVYYLYLSSFFVSSLKNAFDSEYFGIGFMMILVSIAGIVGGLRIIEEDRANAFLMIIAGGLSLLIFPVGVFPALLFFIGGALILLKKG